MANILIVDDVDEVRKKIGRTLLKNGHKIEEAANGEDALTIIRKGNIDLIILDIIMPGKGGIGTLLELKNYKDFKIIIITGIPKPDSEAFNNLIDHFGAKTILYKPFKQEELIKAVNDALS